MKEMTTLTVPGCRPPTGLMTRRSVAGSRCHCTSLPSTRTSAMSSSMALSTSSPTGSTTSTRDGDPTVEHRGREVGGQLDVVAHRARRHAAGGTGRAWGTPGSQSRRPPYRRGARPRPRAPSVRRTTARCRCGSSVPARARAPLRRRRDRQRARRRDRPRRGRVPRRARAREGLDGADRHRPGRAALPGPRHGRRDERRVGGQHDVRRRQPRRAGGVHRQGLRRRPRQRVRPRHERPRRLVPPRRAARATRRPGAASSSSRPTPSAR